MYISPAYRLKLYRNFKSIDPKDPYSIIRYFEQYEEELNLLDLDEYLDCSLTYTDALFETDEFARHIVMCDHLIELVMYESLTYWAGEDIFSKLVFRKGVSYYNLGDHPNAIRVLKSVAKIKPDNPETAVLLLGILQEELPQRRLKIRALGLFFILLSAISAGFSGLVVQPFFIDYHTISVNISIALFTLGGLTYLYAEISHYLRCKKTVGEWTTM